MHASPHFFGPRARSRFGFLHWPEGQIRGAVVICPPLAYEQVCAHRTLRQLAERLAADGMVTLRLDYDGTGNAIGSADDPHRVAGWKSSIADAVAELQDFGFQSVTLVGLRLGATLAATVAPDTPVVDRLVLWDPVESGRRYARGLRLMSSSGVDAASHGGTESLDAGVAVAGIAFTEQTLADLREVQLDPKSINIDTLIVARLEGAEAAGGAETNAAGGADVLPPNVHVVRIKGTSALLDGDAERAVVPAAILDAIEGWLREHCHDPLEPQPRRPVLRSVAVEQTDAGIVRHEAVRIEPAGLFAVQTTMADTRPRRAVVMGNNGVASLVGPGRAWIDFAVDCAANGWLALRMDFSGLGDSQSRPGRPEHDSYPPTAGVDVRDAVTYLKLVGIERVALVGLCSGALLAFDAALAAPEIDLLLGINGRFDKPFTDSRRDRRYRAGRQSSRLLSIPLTKAPLFPVLDTIPTWIWRSLDRLHLIAAPTHLIDRVLGRGGIKIVMLFGSDEWGLKALRRRGGKRFQRLVHDPAVRLIEVPGLDHSMFNATAKGQVEAQLLQVLVGTDHQSSASR